MNTLTAAPIARKKLYSLERWAAATEGHDKLLVTEEDDILEEIGKYAPATLYEKPPDPDISSIRHEMCSNRFNAAWEVIISFAEASGYTHILSLESDVIPPEGVDIVELMESQWDDTVDFLIHLYPWRPSYNRPGRKSYEMGCTMARTETWRKALDTMPPTAVLYWCVYQTPEKNPKFHFTNKRIDLVELQHVEE